MTAEGPLAGRTALVTGAGGGIGLACARGLAAAGADLVLWARGDVSAQRDELASTGRLVRTVNADLADLDATAEAAEALLAETPVDILLNNAGTIRRAPAADYPLTDWQHVLRVNLDAVHVLSQAVGARMIERGTGGRILTIASLLSFQGGILVPAYTASKHAVAGLTKALANEWARHGITVNAVAPGYIATANTEALRADPEREAAIRERIPAGRWGTPEDIVGAVLFLAGDGASYVNGHTLVVDGGWLAR